MLRGFSVPLSPEGRATLAPAPPWSYVGDVLVIEFRADPDAVAAVLPPGLDQDDEDPGRCTAFFIDWQYASSSGDEPLDPVRSQYREFILLADARHRGEAVSTCPYIYVDSDASMARGWIQGWPKRLGAIHTTRAFALRSPAAPSLEAGATFAGTLSAGGRRLAEGAVSLEGLSAAPVVLGSRPIVNVRHFPRLDGGGRRPPAVHELVRSILSDVQRTEVWEGSARLDLLDAPDHELFALRPRETGRGFRYTTSLRVDDLEVLEPVPAVEPVEPVA